MLTVFLPIWFLVMGIVIHGVDVKHEKLEKKFDNERVQRNDDKELAAYLDALSMAREGKSVHDALENR